MFQQILDNMSGHWRLRWHQSPPHNQILCLEHCYPPLPSLLLTSTVWLTCTHPFCISKLSGKSSWILMTGFHTVACALLHSRLPSQYLPHCTASDCVFSPQVPVLRAPEVQGCVLYRVEFYQHCAWHEVEIQEKFVEWMNDWRKFQFSFLLHIKYPKLC